MRSMLKIANAYGNYDIRDRLPNNYSHIKGNRLQPICRKLKIKFCDALIGFKTSRYGSKPILDGVVVSAKSVDKLAAAIQAREKRNTPAKREKAKIAREKRESAKKDKERRELLSKGVEPGSLTAVWYQRGDIDEHEAQLISFKTYYRHRHTDYEKSLDFARQHARKHRKEYGESVKELARDLLIEDPIPDKW